MELISGVMLPGYDDFKIIECSRDQWLQLNKFTIIDLAKGLLMQFMKLIWHELYQLNRLIFNALTTELKKWICHQRWQKHRFLMHCLTCHLDLVWWLRVVPPSVMSLLFVDNYRSDILKSSHNQGYLFLHDTNTKQIMFTARTGYVLKR